MCCEASGSPSGFCFPSIICPLSVYFFGDISLELHFDCARAFSCLVRHLEHFPGEASLKSLAKKHSVTGAFATGP